MDKKRARENSWKNVGFNQSWDGSTPQKSKEWKYVLVVGRCGVGVFSNQFVVYLFICLLPYLLCVCVCVCVCCARDPTQGFVHARLSIPPLSYIASPSISDFLNIVSNVGSKIIN
jgi:hypothetical protein